MTLADSIQAQVDKDIEKLEAQYKSNLQDVKNNWSFTLSEVKKLHSEKIDEAVSTQINFKKFQQSKTTKFELGYAIQTQLDNIYKDLIPEILNSNFVKELIQKAVQDIPKSTTLTLEGQYSNILEKMITSLGYKTQLIDNEKILGTVQAQLESGHLEITIEDILDIVKQKTLTSVMKEI
jgi:hypothetical protein